MRGDLNMSTFSRTPPFCNEIDYSLRLPERFITELLLYKASGITTLLD